MSDYPDQRLIDEFYRNLKGERKGNGHGGENGRANPGASKLTDQAVLEKIFGEKARGEDFRDTYRGDYKKHRPDWTNSEAVASILRKAAFYSNNDPLQMERLIRGSALACAKFDDSRGGSTWLADEIGEAIADTPVTYQDRLLSSSFTPIYMSDDDDNKEIVWFSELEEPKKREYLIEELCAKGYPFVAFGAGGVAKSLLMLQAGIAIASRNLDEWLGWNVLQDGHVLYLDFELDLDEQHRRVRDLCAGLSVVVPKRLAYLSGIGITTDAAFSRALRFCKEHEAVAVIVDSMGLAMQGDMEHAKDVLAFHRKYIEPFRRMNVTPLLVDHEGKLQSGEKHRDKSPFGSAFKAWAARSVLQFELEEYDRENSALDLRIRQTKTNFGPKIEPFGVRLTFEAQKISTEVIELEDAELAEEESIPGRERIIGVLTKGSAVRKEIEEITGLSGGTIRNILSDLMQEGIVGEEGYRGRSKVYCLLSSSPENTKGDDNDDNNKAASPKEAVRESFG